MQARVTHATPKSRHRAVCDAYPINLNLRLYRALSWLARGNADTRRSSCARRPAWAG